ncbi:glutaredoxin family protein [Kocuria palustris]|uniref:glutaredoxin family protein n=1 Tax=Kocuria palustris TaxID=71999 RepID=UPI00077B7BA9|nr:glutaredoxin family protein [Kocuria palustris]
MTEQTPGQIDLSVPPLRLITRQGCHLCQAARDTVAAAAQRHGLEWAETDITQLPESEQTQRWQIEVPVLLIDGRQRDFWQIDPRRLERLLLQRGA